VAKIIDSENNHANIPASARTWKIFLVRAPRQEILEGKSQFSQPACEFYLFLILAGACNCFAAAADRMQFAEGKGRIYEYKKRSRVIWWYARLITGAIGAQNWLMPVSQCWDSGQQKVCFCRCAQWKKNIVVIVRVSFPSKCRAKKQ
jgi:hypothetical protein